ncbi:hypothetical protein [Planomonospora parontospora]|uniref:hypothetical protein n=1 Tax=Planomonospora parontospora TaxID=58119 RepID=UPI001670576C|nr:hypothetical protein [Planomonospora parontospora]GGL11765.1 membrane protein [Planomonospora parontospora subsp. antibiotica]GII14930.1 membrane protein [Planomonospora parontospora subsp. antibiotica]
MEGLLLSIHVLAGIVFVGGSAVAASLFPRYAPIAAASPAAPIAAASPAVPVASGVPAGAAAVDPAAADATADPRPEAPGDRNRAVAVAMHRITRGYGVLAVVVPVVGIVLAFVQGRIGEIWISVSMALTAAAGGLLALWIRPLQSEALADPDDGGRLRTLSMLAGVYNLLWAAVVVLMIVRPGSDYS